MCKKNRCIYCNKILDNKSLSNEHIIQNAYGNNNFNKYNFRQKTYYSNEVVSYPFSINKLLKNKVIDCRIYTYHKFQKLTNYLLIDKKDV